MTEDARHEETPPPAEPVESRTDEPGEDPLRRSRTSSIWVALVVMAVLLLLLIIFIAQNTQDVDISFLGWSGRAPLSVSLLAATLTGIVIVIVAGSLRILQLRRRVRRVQR